MAEVVRIIPVSRDTVFDVLADPYTYPRWVVGAKRIRSVDDDWPEPGSGFHHVVGMFPLQLSDSTRIIEWEFGDRLVLDARARPSGRVQVEFELTELPGGTQVRMNEYPTSGPVKLLPDVVMDFLIRRRNAASLARLEGVVTDRR